MHLFGGNGRHGRHGASGHDSDGYDYEHGQYATIKLEWDDRRRVLRIGERQGAFEGMETNRTFRVVVAGDTGKKKEGMTVEYDGKAVKCKM